MHSEVGIPGVESFHFDETLTRKESEKKEIEKYDLIIEKYGPIKSSLLSILLDIQAEFNYLPRLALTHVSNILEIPFSRVYSTATFYRAFSLEPRGKHIVTVCLGTACHVRGAPKIVDEISRKLKIEPGETTEDMQFTLESVNCLGCCAIGPIMVVDEEYYGLPDLLYAGFGLFGDKINSILAKYRD